MTVVIEDERTLAELKRMAVGLSVPPEEVVRRAVLEKAEREREETPPWRTRAEFDAAVHALQEWGAAHRDPTDRRTPDEIIGYNEQGLFD